MPFDFPSSPSEGQIFNAPSGPSYVFQNPVWRAIGQGQIAIISDTAPANPANGTLWFESDTGILFIWMNDGNSSQWVQVGGVQASVSPTQTVFTASGTWTKPVGCRSIEIEAVGGGGAGGNTTGVNPGIATGGGGGSGAYTQTRFDVTAVSSIVFTVGAGGFGVAGPTDGAAGGTTSFTVGGTTYQLPGGAGGNGGTGGATGSIYAGGASGVGINLVYGSNPGQTGSSIAASIGASGSGASSPLGRGGVGARYGSTIQAAGNDALGYGSGGSGSIQIAATTNRAGGNGTGGFVRVTEFY